MLGRVAATGEPYVSRDGGPRSVPRAGWSRPRASRSFVHVPLSLGGAPVRRAERGARGARPLRRRRRCGGWPRSGVGAAGAIANALDFQRERRLAPALDARLRARAAGRADRASSVGLVYEPSGHEAGGGDLFGVWRLPSGALALLVGDVSGKGLEVAAISAMVRFFVEARAWDSDRPPRCSRRPTGSCARRLPAAGFATGRSSPSSTAGAIRYCNAGHPPPLLLRGGRRRAWSCAAAGSRSASTRTARYDEREPAFEPGDVAVRLPPTGCSRRAASGRFFGDERLPALLAEHGRTLAPQALGRARAARRPRRWAPSLHDDVVVLALAPRARARACATSPPDGPAAQALFGEYMALVRERLGPEFEPTEAHLRHRARVRASPGAALLVLYDGGVPVGCGGCARSTPSASEIKRMFVTAPARRAGPRAAAAGRARGLAATPGDPHPPAHHRGAARGARALPQDRVRDRLQPRRGRPPGLLDGEGALSLDPPMIGGCVGAGGRVRVGRPRFHVVGHLVRGRSALANASRWRHAAGIGGFRL